jgi:hypothetical protein
VGREEPTTGFYESRRTGLHQAEVLTELGQISSMRVS